MPHLHLPLQSGSAEILRRMNRQYGRDEFIDMIERVRTTLDRPAISTDIIVGFPGETEADFQASIEIARYAQFCKIHAFPFSPREKTAAARWQKDFVHPSVVHERMHRLAEVEQECSLAFRRRFIGELERMIVEDSKEPDHRVPGEHRIHHGRANRYFTIHFETNGPHSGPHDVNDVRTGDLVDVHIDRVTPTRTHGVYLRTNADANPLCSPSAVL